MTTSCLIIQELRSLEVSNEAFNVRNACHPRVLTCHDRTFEAFVELGPDLRSNWKADRNDRVCIASQNIPLAASLTHSSNGASGIQVTTALQEVAGHVDHYARSRTWVAGNFNAALKDRQNTPMYISEDQRESFKDPKVYLRYRKELEDGFFRGFDGQLKDSETSKQLRQNFIEVIKKRTSERPELLENLVPDLFVPPSTCHVSFANCAP